MNILKKLFTPFANVSKPILTVMVVVQVILTLAVWQMSANQMIPNPGEVGKALIGFLSDKEFYNDLLTSIGLTMKAMLFSIIIASVIAWLSVLPFFKPIALFLVRLRFMSLIGLIFTFTLILKSGSEVKISMLMFGIIPFFVLSLLSVIERIDKREYQLCQTLKYSRWQMLYELVIFGRMDYTLETIRANFAMGWLMITVVESFSMSEGGIGVMLFRLNKYNQLDKIFALQLVIFCLGIMFDTVLMKMRYALFPHVKLAEVK